MQILDIIQNDRATPTDAASTARGLLNQLQMSETYFRCAVAFRLFAITDAFATAVQHPTINIAEVIHRKREVLNELHSFRGQFDFLFDNALNEATRLDLDDMKLPRKKRMPARYDITGTNFQFDNVRALHHSQFYESVDVLVSTIDMRLDEQ